MSGDLDEIQEWYEEGNVTDPEESEVHRGPDRGKIIRELREENQRLRDVLKQSLHVLKKEVQFEDPFFRDEFVSKVEKALEETE